MDVAFSNESGSFSLRTAGLILREGKLLAAKHDAHDCFYLPGGGVRQGESTRDALLRELREETGRSFGIDRLVFVQERFYRVSNDPHHEVVFFYLMQAGEAEIREGAVTDRPCEHLHWLGIGSLADAPLIPAFLRTALQSSPKKTVHIVSDGCVYEKAAKLMLRGQTVEKVMEKIQLERTLFFRGAENEFRNRKRRFPCLHS